MVVTIRFSVNAWADSSTTSRLVKNRRTLRLRGRSGIGLQLDMRQPAECTQTCGVDTLRCEGLLQSVIFRTNLSSVRLPFHILEASRIKRTLILIKMKAMMKSYSQGHASYCIRNRLGHASKLYCPSRMLQSIRRCSSLNQSGARQLPQTLQIRRQRLAKSSAGRTPTVSRQV